MNKKKILFVTPTLGGGGAERVICNIVNNLDSNEYDIHVFVIAKGEHVYVKNLLDHINIIYGNKENRLRYNIFYILKIIRKVSPDIVFLGAGGLNVLIAPFIRFFKKIKWIARETNTVSKHNTSKIQVFLLKKFYNNFDTIIAQCNDMKDDLIVNFSVDPNIVKVINNPLDCKVISENQKKQSSKAKEYFSNGKVNLVACGRLTEQKGFDLLLSQFSEIPNLGDYHLTIIGRDQDSYSEYLNQIILEKNISKYVSLLPFNENIHAWLSEADIFILSSRYEGFPNILLEALCCGIPALVNNCLGGVSEIINKDNGLIFNFNQEGSFQSKLKEIQPIEFDRDRIKETVAKYDIDIIIPKFHQILQ